MIPKSGNRWSLPPKVRQWRFIVQFAEVGEGSLPIAECIEAGKRCGCEFFFIEQDITYDRKPLESVKISHDNLVKMGYGDWF